MSEDYVTCRRSVPTRGGLHPTFVAERPAGQAAIADEQSLSGYSVLVAKRHVAERHHLGDPSAGAVP